MRALVIEGGGSRAAYASGVADALAEARLRFDAVYGTSAGGAIGAWFAAGQTRDGARTWDYTRDAIAFSYWRWFTLRGPLWSLARIYNGVYVNEIPLDLEAVRESAFPVWVTLTDADSGEAEYRDLRRGNILQLLSATSAIPYLTEGPVATDGRRFFDGGLADPLPVERALDEGANELVVVGNRPPGWTRSAEGRWMLRRMARQFPGAAKALERRHLAYNGAVRAAEQPPPGVRCTLIRPTGDTGLRRLTRDAKVLMAGIERGREDGRRAAAALRSAWAA